MVGHGPGILLIASIGGYWVLERSAKQKGYVHRMGQILGTAIILISLIGIACGVLCMGSGSGGMCHLRAGKGMCPFTSKSISPASPTSPSE